MYISLSHQLRIGAKKFTFVITFYNDIYLIKILTLKKNNKVILHCYSQRYNCNFPVCSGKSTWTWNRWKILLLVGLPLVDDLELHSFCCSIGVLDELLPCNFKKSPSLAVFPVSYLPLYLVALTYFDFLFHGCVWYFCPFKISSHGSFLVYHLHTSFSFLW